MTASERIRAARDAFAERLTWKPGDVELVEPVDSDRNSMHEHAEIGPSIRYQGDAEAGLKDTLAKHAEPIRCTCPAPGCAKHGFQVIRLTEGSSWTDSQKLWNILCDLRTRTETAHLPVFADELATALALLGQIIADGNS